MSVSLMLLYDMSRCLVISHCVRETKREMGRCGWFRRGERSTKRSCHLAYEVPSVIHGETQALERHFVIWATRYSITVGVGRYIDMCAGVVCRGRPRHISYSMLHVMHVVVWATRYSITVGVGRYICVCWGCVWVTRSRHISYALLYVMNVVISATRHM